VRDEFRAIVSGWTLVDGMEDITDRIERAAQWTAAHGPLEPDEQATVKLMIRTQIARGIRRGDWEPLIPADIPEEELREFLKP
jgi:hypothetical protein